MSAGVSAAGLEIKTLAEVNADIETEQLAEVDAELDTAPDQPLGQINGIFSKKVAELWELCQTAFGAFDDTQCEGSLLEALCALTGTKRQAATRGRVTVSCALLAGATLTTDHVLAVAGDPANKWRPVFGFTAFISGTYPVTFECLQTGPVEALAGTLTVIVTPVVGWTSATNAADAVPGFNRETDEELRVKRRKELAAVGQCTAPALAAELDKLEGVINARVFENTTGAVTYVDGWPLAPHSLWAVIWDGIVPAATDADVAKTIWENKPGGIGINGSILTAHTDSTGVSRWIQWDRATQVPVAVVLTLKVDTSKFPVSVDPLIDGESRVKAAIAALSPNQGEEQIRLDIMSLAKASAPGIKDVTVCTLNGVAANVVVGEIEVATYDTSAITISVVS